MRARVVGRWQRTLNWWTLPGTVIAKSRFAAIEEEPEEGDARMSQQGEMACSMAGRQAASGDAARQCTMPGEKAHFKGTIGKLVRFMGQFKVAFIAAIVFAMASAAFNIVGPKVLSQATTELFDGIVAKIGGTGGIDFDAVGAILLATLALYCVSAACSFVQGWMMTSVSQRTCYGLRRQIAEKIDRLPVGYFERTSTGDVLSRITNDVDTLGQSLNQGVTQLITSATTMIGVLVMMLSINVEAGDDADRATAPTPVAHLQSRRSCQRHSPAAQ